MVAVFGEEVVGGALEFDCGLSVSALPWTPAIQIHTSCMMASISSCGLKEKPCSIAVLNVPPGGSSLGFVQYTPVLFRSSCPPYAYSLSPITTPECRSELPIAHSTVETLPGGSRS